jgi:hypothetical protein
MCKSVTVTTYRWLINPVTNPNPVLVTNTRDNIYMSVCVCVWTAEGLEFEPQQGKDFSFFHSVQTDCEAHPASFPGSKAAGA